LQGGLEIGECQADLGLEVRFRRAVRAAAHLAGDEQEVVAAHRRRIAVALVQGLAAGGKDDVSGIHGVVLGRTGGPGAWGHSRWRRHPDKRADAGITVCRIETIPTSARSATWTVSMRCRLSSVWWKPAASPAQPTRFSPAGRA